MLNRNVASQNLHVLSCQHNVAIATEHSNNVAFSLATTLKLKILFYSKARHHLFKHDSIWGMHVD